MAVNNKGEQICWLYVEDSAYRVWTPHLAWKNKTSYLCEFDSNGICKYYIDTIDECLGEISRLVTYVVHNEPHGYSALTINWDADTEQVLSQLKNTLDDVFTGTEFYLKRNPTNGEEQVNLYKNGESGRVAFMHPKKKLECMDFCLRTELHTLVKHKIELPEDVDIKPGRYIGWRRMRGVSLQKAQEICLTISGKLTKE